MSNDNIYKGVLWGISESPYFKGMDMEDEIREEFDDLTIGETSEMKWELEEKIAKLLQEYQDTTGLDVSEVIVDNSGEDIDVAIVVLL